MSNKIGVLGSATATTLGTTTVYTCPAGKAAKGRIMFRAQAGANSTLDFLVNSMTVMSSGALTAANFIWSTKGAGLSIAASATAPSGIGAALTVSPADQIYYLSVGQTIQYTVGTLALQAMNAQFVGAEIDV